MQQAIWAIFLHKLSTDEKPQHGFCPSDSDTWCKFKKAELLGETYYHKNSLPVDVVEAMRPVFRDLANPELLKKCLHGGTQNPNESVNNVICTIRSTIRSFVTGRWSASTNRGCYEQNTIVYKKQRKKEDDELLKNADDLEYGAGLF
ncbi:uncharacterized protein TNCV_3444411 [Trichonephila clavipes]|nr:uncharacterized protein TNCV_3444411 [Trichonephila clavipes]